jgi:hypothetical protein
MRIKAQSKAEQSIGGEDASLGTVGLYKEHFMSCFITVKT